MPADLSKYGNTYDITAKKWVKDMTDSELETYGYKEKEDDGEEGQSLQTVASKTRAKKTVA